MVDISPPPHTQVLKEGPDERFSFVPDLGLTVDDEAIDWDTRPMTPEMEYALCYQNVGMLLDIRKVPLESAIVGANQSSIEEA